MKKIMELIGEQVTSAFEKAGYDGGLGAVNLSNRPDLCQYQCNGAMAAAKKYHKAPIAIAGDVVELLKGNIIFESVEAVPPGFINITLSPSYIAGYMQNMSEDDRLGCN